MMDRITEILIGQEQIKQKVQNIANTINEEYQGKEICFIAVLKGATIFMSDLIRLINIPIEIDFVAISSYGNSTKSSGKIKLIKDLSEDVMDKDIIIVEDIVDTGRTVHFLRAHFEHRSPASVKIITLLDKPQRREIDVKIDYKGFTIPDMFVVGYGLDYAGKYRNLPDIRILNETK
jgi:hypoxanthine phosphoribosyltransferase